MVGCRLLYPNSSLEPAASVLGSNSLTGTLLSRLPGASPSYIEWAGVVRECSTVSRACMMSRRGLLEELSGFDKKHYSKTITLTSACAYGIRYHMIFPPTRACDSHESPAERARPSL